MIYGAAPVIDNLFLLAVAGGMALAWQIIRSDRTEN